MDGHHHHGRSHINDSQMRECDSHDPLYSTIEETKQLPIENLYQEVSGKGDEDKNNNIRERSVTENVVSHEQNDPTEARNDVPDENVKPGHESEVDVCCGWGSNNKVIAIKFYQESQKMKFSVIIFTMTGNRMAGSSQSTLSLDFRFGPDTVSIIVSLGFVSLLFLVFILHLIVRLDYEPNIVFK